MSCVITLLFIILLILNYNLIKLRKYGKSENQKLKRTL